MVEEMLNISRDICMSLPFATEKLSHGAPAWFVQDKRQFAVFWNNHHNDGRLALHLAAPMGSQQALVSAAPEWFLASLIFAHRGWIGVLDEDHLVRSLPILSRKAYLTVAPAKLPQCWVRASKIRHETSAGSYRHTIEHLAADFRRVHMADYARPGRADHNENA